MKSPIDLLKLLVPPIGGITPPTYSGGASPPPQVVGRFEPAPTTEPRGITTNLFAPLWADNERRAEARRITGHGMRPPPNYLREFTRGRGERWT